MAGLALSLEFLKHVTEGENVLGCSFLTSEESRDNMFWITQLCRREWSGYFPLCADCFAFFCLLIPWHGAGLVQAKSANKVFPDSGNPNPAKCSTRLSLGDAGA